MTNTQRGSGSCAPLCILLMAAVLRASSGVAAEARSGAASQPASGALKVMDSNCFYFQDAEGRPVVLIGDYTWGIFSDLDYDYRALFDSHHGRGLNQCRVWLWWGAEQFPPETRYVGGPRHLEPYVRPGPGTANDGRLKYDLARFNPAFFERLRDMCAAARRRGIFLQLITVDAWMLKHAHLWKLHAYQRDNNINGVDGDPQNTGKGTDGSKGFCSLGNPKALEFQKAYVRKLVDTVNDFDNIYFEIANENSASAQWELHLCDFIKECEKGRALRHLTMPRDLPSHGQVVQRWDPPLVHVGMLARRSLKQPLIFDTDWVINSNDDEVRKAMWLAVLSGGHFSYMDDSLPFCIPPGKDNRPELHKQIDHMAAFMKSIKPWEMQPNNGLVRSDDAFAMASDTTLAAYLPNGAAVTIDLTKFGGPLRARWYDPRKGVFLEETQVQGGGPLELRPPDAQDWALLIQKRAEK